MEPNITDLKQSHSPTIGKLAMALARAQGEIRNAVKDSTNPHLKSKYADLASVWDACRKPLADNNLAVVQTFEGGGDGKLTTHTMLIHGESGEWIKGSMTMTAVKNDPQGIGACSTYERRFSLSAMVGVAPDDDDGNEASGKPKTDGKKEGNREASVKPAENKAKAETKTPETKAPVEAFDKKKSDTNSADIAYFKKAIVHGIFSSCEGNEGYALNVLKELTAYVKDGKQSWLTFDDLKKIEKVDYLKRLLGKVKAKGYKVMPFGCSFGWPEAGCDIANYVPNENGDMKAYCGHVENEGPCPFVLDKVFK